MIWNNRRYRPAPKPVYPRRQESIADLMKPLGEKERKGNIWIPVLSIPMNVPQEGGAPQPFDPSQISGLQVWLDAADESTLNTYTSGSEVIVSGWTSKGAWTGTLSAETETRAPRYITNGGEGSNPAVYLYTGATSAVNSGLVYRDDTNTFPIESGVTMFIFSKVLQNRLDTQGWLGTFPFYMSQYTGSTSSGYGQSRLGHGGGNQFNIDNQTGATSGYQIIAEDRYTSVAYRNITPYVLKGWAVDNPRTDPNGYGYNIIGQQFYYGAPTRLVSPFDEIKPRNINQVTIGITSYGTSTPNYFNSFTNGSEIYEILVWDRKLTDQEYQQVQTYLLDKWDYTIDVPTGYTEVTITEYTADLTGNTPSTGNVWFVQENVPLTSWSASLGDLSNSKMYFINNDTIRFNASAPGTAGYFANYDIYANGILADKLTNLSSAVTSPQNLADYAKPITISGVSQYELFPTTFYINYTGTTPTSQFFVYDRYRGGGNLIAVNGIQTLNTAITYSLEWGWAPFDISYTDSSNTGADFAFWELNDCTQGDHRTLIDAGFALSFTQTPVINPGWCVEINVKGAQYP